MILNHLLEDIDKRLQLEDATVTNGNKIFEFINKSNPYQKPLRFLVTKVHNFVKVTDADVICFISLRAFI